MPFLALDLSLDLIRGLRPTIELLRQGLAEKTAENVR